MRIIRNRWQIFFDIFYIGEGEKVYDRLFDVYKEVRARGGSRQEFLEAAAEIEGIYVPSFYETTYHEDGTIRSFDPVNPHAKPVVHKQVVMEMQDTTYPEKPVVAIYQGDPGSGGCWRS